jgi:hypothetical protein
VTRVSYPFWKSNIEPGLKRTLVNGLLKRNFLVFLKTNNILFDQRVAVSFVLYPKPFGVQAEYNIGKGPRYNKITNSVDVSSLEGGYVTLNYKWDLPKKSITIRF